MHNYDGGRTPGYPLYLFLCEMLAGGDIEQRLTPLSGQVVVWIQSILGVLSVFLLYFTMERLFIRLWVRFALALFYAFIFVVAQSEMLILSDSLCLSFTVISIYLMTIMADRLRRRLPTGWTAAWAGAASSAVLLIRPSAMFIWLVFMGLLLIVSFLKADVEKLASRMRKACVICLVCGSIPVGAWLLVNYENTGCLTLTPLSAMLRTCAAYNLFDQVHPEDRVVGDIMVKYYRQYNGDGHVRKDYVMTAIGDLMGHYQQMPLRANPPNPPVINMAVYLGQVSNYLLIEHPRVWLQNILSDWCQTFDFRYARPGLVLTGDPISLTGTSVITNIPRWRFLIWFSDKQAGAILATYLLTYVAVVIAAVRLVRARNLAGALRDLVPLALALATFITILAICALSTYYNRYSLSLLPIFALESAYVIEWVCQFRDKNGPVNQ